MSERAFIDTNIWLYAFIQGQEPYKHKIAVNILRQCTPIVSTQVINEVCVNMIKKAHVNESIIEHLIRSFYQNYYVVQPNEEILLIGSRLRRSYSLSFWDSLIVAAALFSGSSVLYTEDMQDGLVVEGSIKIVNPFVRGDR